MKLKKISFCAFVLLQLIIFNIFAENVNFTSSINVSTSAGSNLQIAVNGTGSNLYGIWGETPGDDIKISFSTDSGLTWTSSSGSFGKGFFPIIITDTSGRYVYAIWRNDSNAIKIFVSTDFGASFVAATEPFGTGNKPQITIDSTGKYVYAIWMGAVNNIQIYFSTDFGSSWTAATGSFGDGLTPQITTDSTGSNISAVWIDTGSGETIVFFSTNFGSSWTAASGSFGNGSVPQITSDSSGKNVYIIFADNPSENVEIFRSTNFGATFQAVSGSFGIVDATNTTPQIITDNSGRYVHAIWLEKTTKNIKIFSSIDFGETFQAALGSFGQAATSGPPQIITDNSGRYVYTIWRDDSTNNIKVFISLDFGFSWTDADSSNTIFGTGFDPQIATNNSGSFIFPIWDSAFIELSKGTRSFYPITNLSTKR